jgi:hypothetical protein
MDRIEALKLGDDLSESNISIAHLDDALDIFKLENRLFSAKTDSLKFM